MKNPQILKDDIRDLENAIRYGHPEVDVLKRKLVEANKKLQDFYECDTVPPTTETVTHEDPQEDPELDPDDSVPASGTDAGDVPATGGDDGTTGEFHTVTTGRGSQFSIDLPGKDGS